MLGLAAVGGQLIGGALVQTDFLGLGWRGCFLINVPIGLAALVATPRLVPESRVEAPGDRPGARTRQRARARRRAGGGAAAADPGPRARLAGVDVGLARGRAADPRRLRRLAGAPRPPGGPALLDLRLFRERTVSAGLATQLALATVQAAFFVYLALYLQQGRGLNPLRPGSCSHPRRRLRGHLRPGARAGRRATVHGDRRRRRDAGSRAVALAFAVGSIGVGGSMLALVPGLLLVGAGIGLCFTPIQQTVLGEIDPALAGAASGCSRRPSSSASRSGSRSPG